MKLTEIKKCKVPELRVRLTELGLETKGLKTELVGRLWSALEAGLQKQSNQSCQDSETVHASVEEVKTQDDYPSLSSTEMEVDVASSDTQTIHLHQITSRSEDVDAAPCKPFSATTYTDTATQTDSDTTVPTLLAQDNLMVEPPDFEVTTKCLSKQGSQRTWEREPLLELQTGTIQESDSVQKLPIQEHTEHHKTPEAYVSKQGSERMGTRHGPVTKDVGEELGRGQGEKEDAREDRRPLVVEEMDRGRAFYEFKEEIRYKRAKSPPPPPEREEVEEADEEKIKIDPYACDLHFEVGPDGTCGQPQFWERFPLLWSGCRLTHGLLKGRVGFEVRLDRKLLTAEPEEQADGGRSPEPYGLRVGWSVSNSSLLLGEEKLSYAYDGRGKKVSGQKEEEFGETLSDGDIIGCYAFFSRHGAVELSFHKNGRPMGVAFCLGASVLRGRALFPHVLCRSCSVRFHLDPTAPSWYPSPPGYTPLVALPVGDRLRAPLAPTSRRQSEVVMMVGLPGSGKSHWAKAYMEQQPEKRFKLLGNEALLACMISGGQRESRLQQASQCLTELIKMAAQTPGNYILDQTNVLFSARRHKLQLFRGFRRRAVVVFPSAEEWKRRLAQHQSRSGEQIPEAALLKLQVSCSLPEQQNELLEELQYVELPREQAQALLQEYREEARRLLPPAPKRERKKPRLQKSKPVPYYPPPSHRSQWNGRYGWNGTKFNLPLWGPQPRYWDLGYPDQERYYNSRGCGYSSYQGY
ncbi:heterogeneous nuclear ribonucleoprotein U-like protein 2 isoform 2-T2 [Polymixia lowei]